MPIFKARKGDKKMEKIRLIIIAAILLTLLGNSAELAAQQFPNGLVFWNKLGSEQEVENSEFGPNFEIRRDGGDVLFVAGMFGGALATTGGTAHLGPAGGYLVMSPDDFFAPDQTKGTVEVWIQKRTDKFIPYQSPLLTIFGRQPYATGYDSIMATWYDGYNQPPCVGWPQPQDCKNSLRFGIRDGEASQRIIYDYDWEFVPVGQWIHVAFVWDGAGIEGGCDDIRIYRDGVVVSSHQGRFSEVYPRCLYGYDLDPDCSHGYEVRVLAHHEYDRLGFPSAYLDNLKVWDYAKTDFSDRFFESFDSDGDGYPDEVDECPDSDLTGTVVIDGSDTGVENRLLDNGCTISDRIAECAENTRNHGEFVSNVSHLTNNLKKTGIISGREKGKIQSCAAKANIP
jgi:hypothetical protein